MPKKSKTIHYTLCGLEYVYLIDVPIGKDGKDEFIDIPPEEIDRMIAVEIIRQKVPLRGKEHSDLSDVLKKTIRITALILSLKGVLNRADLWHDLSHIELHPLNSL
jgi:hypothetical protein